MDNKPVVFVGGLLSAGRELIPKVQTLAAHTSGPLFVVDFEYSDWLPVMRRRNWVSLLDKIDRTVQAASAQSQTSKITLIGHSAGGILARLYLSSEPFYGRSYCGEKHVERLVTLASPNTGEGMLLKDDKLLGWVNRSYPGTAFAPQVSYTSVAGSSVRGRRIGTIFEVSAYNLYRALCGTGSTFGDGTIPVESALLPGSNQFVVTGARHYPHFGWYWYLSPSAIKLWW